MGSEADPKLVLYRLRKAGTLHERLKIVAESWKALHRLTPEERVRAIALIGLKEAGPLLEQMGRPGGVDPEHLKAAVEAVEGARPDEVRKVIRTFTDPKERKEALREGLEVASEILLKPEPPPPPATAPQLKIEAKPILIPPIQPIPPAPPAPGSSVLAGKASPARDAPRGRQQGPPPGEPPPPPTTREPESHPVASSKTAAAAVTGLPVAVEPEPGILPEKPEARESIQRPEAADESATVGASRPWAAGGNPLALLRRLRHLEGSQLAKIGVLPILQSFPSGWSRRRAFRVLCRHHEFSTDQLTSAFELADSSLDEFWFTSFLLAERADEALGFLETRVQSPMARRLIGRAARENS